MNTEEIIQELQDKGWVMENGYLFLPAMPKARLNVRSASNLQKALDSGKKVLYQCADCCTSFISAHSLSGLCHFCSLQKGRPNCLKPIIGKAETYTRYPNVNLRLTPELAKKYEAFKKDRSHSLAIIEIMEYFFGLQEQTNATR